MIKFLKKFVIFGLLTGVAANYMYDSLSHKEPTTEVIAPPAQSSSVGSVLAATILIIIGIVLVGGEICLCGACMGGAALTGIVFIILGCLIA